MTVKDYHKILGLAHGATERQIKSAYRRLALKYHPDLNNSPEAKERFQEITAAYKYLQVHGRDLSAGDTSYNDSVAREVYRRERERMQQRARAKREKKRREEEFFKRPEWHDPILLLKYSLHIFTIIFATAAIIVPIAIAIFVDPASLAGTLFFLIAGAFLMTYMYQRRKHWFRLGKLKTTWKDVLGYLKMEPSRHTTDRCCYCRQENAGGKPFRVELLKNVDIKFRSYGALNHEAKFKNKVKRVVIPRSARAHYFHKLSSFLKVLSIAGCMLFFPVDSVLWRFMAGIFSGAVLSGILLMIARVRIKTGYLLTPGLLIKLVIWIFALYKTSEVGPGFNIQTTGYVYIVVFGLLFLLDMVLDLILGFFPFYGWMFRPILPQGKVLSSLYHKGYQNYQELPVYSILFPLYKWLF